MAGDEPQSKEITVEIDSSMIEAFYPLIQRGIHVRVESGSSVESLLCNTIGLTMEYVEQRVQTVFLNGKAVDKLDETVLDENAHVALSAAMPGLVGAVMRRDGFFSSLRSGISYSAEEVDAPREPCFVVFRLFNFLVREVAPQLMAGGIWVTGRELRESIARASGGALPSEHTIRINGAERDSRLPVDDQSFPLDDLIYVKTIGRSES